MSSNFHRIRIMAVAFFVGAVFTEAKGATIAAETSSSAEITRAYFGQGVELSAGGPWNNIQFAFDSAAGDGFTPYASGDLYIFSVFPTGASPATLDTISSGIVAKSASISDGYWIFEPNVTLFQNTVFYFIMGNQPTVTPSTLYGRLDPLLPGLAFADTAGDAYIRNTNDLDFVLKGQKVNPIPMPASGFLFASVLFGVVFRRARLRNLTRAVN